ncbi:MAG TPA: (deoxy)nucleoside triphosphate pyrophosphohydrolase [Phycisphaeraceae bacterium]
MNRPNSPIDVAIGVLVEQDQDGQRVLIAQRPQQGVLGGYWEFPGGKCEPGESAQACLAREFEEELGVKIQVTHPIPTLEHRYDHGHVRIFPFYCQRVTGEPQPLQVSQWRWVRPHELASYAFPPANTPLVQRIMADLNGR